MFLLKKYCCIKRINEYSKDNIRVTLAPLLIFVSSVESLIFILQQVPFCA